MQSGFGVKLKQEDYFKVGTFFGQQITLTTHD